MRGRRIAIAAGLLCGALGCTEPPLPRITALVPDQAPPGATVDVIGEGFVEEPAAGFVSVGGVAATTSVWEPLRIRLSVPALPAGATSVVVTVAGRPSAPAPFRVAAAP